MHENVQLRLLGRFTISVDGSPLILHRTGQRVIARVALDDGVEDRGALARSLWTAYAPSRAQANLRGAVWRLPPPVRRHLTFGGGTLAFDDGWDVDLRAVERLAGAARPEPEVVPPASSLRYDLLPDWDEPWLLIHRERYRQLRLHALEDLARRHLVAGRPLLTVDCALLAITSEPLRESAQCLLIRGHLAAGNRAAALANYQRFRWMLAAELGVGPSAELSALFDGTRLAVDV